jgi:NosR/NirI family nitrous oxide reductase transcriptional regulator
MLPDGAHRPRIEPIGGGCFSLGIAILGLALVLAALLHPMPTLGADLPRFLKHVQPTEIFQEADHFGPIQGSPPVAPAYAGDRLLGYAFLNSDLVTSVGYSGKPIHIVVGLALDGTVAGAKLVEHKEPIVLIGIPEHKITAFIKGYVGKNVLQAPSVTAAGTPVDIVSGATVTVMVIGDSILRSAIRVARVRGLGGAQPEVAGALPAPTRTIALPDAAPVEVRDWESLVGDGSVRRLHLTVGDVNEAFVRSGNAEAAGRPEPGAPEETFIDLYVALASVPTIGRSLLGEAGYENLRQRLKPGQHAVLIAAEGPYSFKGSGYVRGGIFDRIEVVQDDETIRFRDRNHERINALAAQGAPRFREIGVFTIPEGVEFDAVEPWRFQLLVQRSIGARDKAFLNFDISYQIPGRYVRTEQRAVTAATSPEAPRRTGFTRNLFRGS